MTEDNDTAICSLCGKGRVTMKLEEIAFRQWSDKGYIQCRVEVMMGTCQNCGAKSFSEESDAVFDAAFKREYDKLP